MDSYQEKHRGTILLKRDKLETVTLIPDVKQILQSSYPHLDQALNIWITDRNSKSISVSVDMIQEQVKCFADKLNVPSDFKFSVG